MKPSARRAGVWLLLFANALALQAASPKTNEPARVKISGFGLIGNREMARLLRNFQSDSGQLTAIDQTFVEDAALVMLSRMSEEGYLNAKLQAGFVMRDGSKQSFMWTNVLSAQLPRDFAAREARFTMQSGVLFRYDPLEITGLKALPEAKARRYFVSGESLFNPRANRVFSPPKLDASLAALQEALRRRGYRAVQVTATEIKLDRTNGNAAVKVHIEEGLQTIVRSVTTELHVSNETQPQARSTVQLHEPYSLFWQQDFARGLREEQYAKGFPDASVDFSTMAGETNGTQVELDLKASVQTGPLIQLGKVRFEGLAKTKKSAVENRVKLKEDEPLNRLEAEKARQRLARLGVFDWVSLRYDEAGDKTRNAVYELKESKMTSLSLLAGYGSYEMLRGGMEFEDRNVFGLAHTLRLSGIQSFKATSGDFLYSIPEVFMEDLDFFVRGSGLRREEVSFTREEFGGSAGFHKQIEPTKTDVSVRYDYQFLNALDLGSTDTNRVGLTTARAAAFILDLSRDMRDNSLLPRSGFKLSGNVELASSSLGGNVDYQLLTLGGSYHYDLGGGRLLHFGLIHGVSFTLGGKNPELPFNKRFFPGGENSIRGYQQGEASPLDASGNQLGAETFTQGNFEFEQLLTRSWSVVTFFDAVGFARERRHYPWDEELYSVGGGVRWRTIIGPVRVEYGYNLHRRPHDPVGTLHLSIGFPF